MNYYNENDKFAAEWLCNLIADGRIPDGKVDTRSIEDIRPSDLSGFIQCHFFAGIAGWSRALELASWPASRAVWTGSCPCQPFSAAGKGAGTTDERHLWPAWTHLISQCKPPIIFGEQVASKQALQWWDIVASDLEKSGYAAAAADLPAAAVEAYHLRSRLFWVAVRGSADFLANLEFSRCEGGRQERSGSGANVPSSKNSNEGESELFWRGADWVQHENGDWRAAKPGTSVLGTRVSGRVVIELPGYEPSTYSAITAIKGFGNAIVPQLAAEFIRSIDTATLTV